MKLLVLGFGITAAATAFGAPAEAQNYPWCAQYSGSCEIRCNADTDSSARRTSIR